MGKHTGLFISIIYTLTNLVDFIKNNSNKKKTCYKITGFDNQEICINCYSPKNG